MSEQGDIEVLCPLSHWPRSRPEMRLVLNSSTKQARRLIRSRGGRLLALVKIARAETIDGRIALRATYRAEAPERAWPTRKSF